MESDLSVDTDLYSVVLKGDPVLKPAEKKSFNIYEDVDGIGAVILNAVAFFFHIL